MMHESSNFNFFDDTSFQALELPYKGNALSMVVLLPKDVAGLPALEQSLTPATLTGWLGNLRSAPKVIVSLPRFTMTQQFELSSALSAMVDPDRDAQYRAVSTSRLRNGPRSNAWSPDHST